jgi:hypothetical protein
MQKELLEYMVMKISEFAGLPEKEIDIDIAMVDMGLSSLFLSELGVCVSEKFKLETAYMLIVDGLSIKEFSQEAARSEYEIQSKDFFNEC